MSTYDEDTAVRIFRDWRLEPHGTGWRATHRETGATVDAPDMWALAFSCDRYNAARLHSEAGVSWTDRADA
ncbi:hypothetical protein Acsp03_47130 [Actinomadura sp. NBRC 104412]|uniref:hypothetical protein n=1 Tax=Actinomadura sp. NBRC 104412 TaxID=3032203 RepID=UPI0024A2529E|nr:hypothetical protein [Actinomadura sp. NBRC 104412]GLZ07247.1 hypothetical protein Acsp03_47130 [Actinomadura sp. NBRC 104412]